MDTCGGKQLGWTCVGVNGKDGHVWGETVRFACGRKMRKNRPRNYIALIKMLVLTLLKVVIKIIKHFPSGVSAYIYENWKMDRWQFGIYLVYHLYIWSYRYVSSIKRNREVLYKPATFECIKTTFI